MLPAQFARVGFCGSLAQSGQVSDCTLIHGVAEKPPMTHTTRSACGPQACFQLWLYILAESQIVHNGTKVGPVGSRIIAEVIGGLLAADKDSYYRQGWTPPGGTFRAQDLLREAGVLPTP
jgi:hypothetical protein